MRCHICWYVSTHWNKNSDNWSQKICPECYARFEFFNFSPLTKSWWAWFYEDLIRE